MRKKYWTILLFIIASTGFSQLDTEHYLAPLTSAVHRFIGDAGHQIIYLSTPSLTPVNYTIYDGANNIINTGTVSNGAPIAYGAAGEMNGPNTDLMIGKNQLNKVLIGRGIRVVSDAPVYCNVRIRSSNNAQAASITAKGKNALGKTFRIGHIPTPQKASLWGLNSLGSKLATFGIYATEDNTTVTINLTKVKPVLHGPGAPNTNAPFTINLNKGETYVLALKNADAPNINAGAGFNGALITSDKSIAVSSGSMGGYMTNNYQADYGADQIVPYDKVGSKYAVVRGASAVNGLEQVMVIAHKNGTEVKINGVVVKTLNAGQYYLANGSKYVNGAMFIETSVPAYAYQFMMGSNKNDNKTPGMNFLPPITCETSNYVDEIPFIDKAGSLNLQGGSVAIVTTKTGSDLEFFKNGVKSNGLLGSPKDVPNSDYIYYKVSNLKGHIAVYSKTLALVSFSGYNGAAGFGGFYSGWKEGVVEDSVTCLPGHIFETSGRYDSYRWFKDGVEITGEINDSLFATETGYYQYEYDKAGCKDTSDSIYAVALSEYELQGDTNFCAGDTVEWEIVGSGFDSLSWNNGTLIDVQTVNIDTAGRTPIRIYSDITQECYVDTSVLTIELPRPEIELRDTTICTGETVTLDADTAGLNYLWTTTETSETIDVNQSAIYELIVTDNDGCKDTASMTLAVESCNTDAEVTKTDFTDKYFSGATTIYTIVARNFGPADVVDGDVSDPLPVGILAGDVTWTATPFGGATSTVNSVMNGALTDEVFIPVGDSIVYTVNIVVPPDFVGDLENTVTITVDNDTFPDNNIAIDLDKKDCNFEAAGTIDSKNPGWVKIGNVVTGVPYAVSPAGGSKTFVPDNGPEKGNTVTTLIYNTGSGNHVSLTRTRYRPNDQKLDVITVYDNTPHGWTGLSGSGTEKAPILGFMAFIDQNRNGQFDSGLETYYRDITSLKFTPTTSGELYMAFYDDGVYTDNAGTINISVKSELASTDIGADTAMCLGNSITLDAQNPDAASWVWSTGETTQTIDVDTTGEYSVEITSVGGCEIQDTINIETHDIDVVLPNDTSFCKGGFTNIKALSDDAISWNWSNGEIGESITVNETGEYKITVTNSFGCADSDSVVVTVYELPVVTVRDTSICPGGTGEFEAVSLTATTYLWKELGDGTTSTITGTLKGIYQVEITDVNGCKDTNEATLTYHLPPTVTVNNDTICIGDPNGQFIATSATAISYVWKDNGSGILDNTSGSTAGDYTVIIEDINTCKDTAIGVLKIDTLPIVSLEGAAICASEQSVDLTAQSATAIEYEWSGLGTGTTATISASDKGNYIVTVTDENGCKNQDDADLQKYDLPTVTIANEAVCLGDTALFTAVSLTATEYEWKENGTGVSQTSKGHQAGIYEVIVTDVNGCKDTTDAALTLHPLPVVTVNNDTICVGDPAGEFTATSATATSYVWSENGKGGQGTISGTKAGNYTVIIEDVNTCKDTATGVLKVDTLPHVFVGDTIICSNVTDFVLRAISSTAVSYEWTGGGVGTNQTTPALTEGNYTVTVTDENGCKQQDDADVKMVEQPEEFKIQGDSLACEGDEIDLIIDVNTDRIEWNTGTDTQDEVVTQTGEYSVTVTNELNGVSCSAVSSKEVEFLPFADEPVVNDVLNCFDYIDEITISLSSNAKVIWDEGESGRTDSNLVVTQEGIYGATLYHYPMCPISVEVPVEEFCPMTFFVPNAFTPNGDGRNDKFEPKMSNIVSYKLMIFNRWGERIFTSHDPSNQWDGTVNGREVQIDVYVYKIIVTGFYRKDDLDEQELVGTVTVIR